MLDGQNIEVHAFVWSTDLLEVEPIVSDVPAVVYGPLFVDFILSTEANVT